MWINDFAKTLIRLAEHSGNAEKAHFARAFARDIGRCYVEANDLPDDPRAAARFEFDCWRWWGREGKLGLPERA